MHQTVSYDLFYTKFEYENQVWTLVVQQGQKPKFGSQIREKSLDGLGYDVAQLRCSNYQF